MKKRRITFEDRLLIEELLRLNYSQKDIARAVDTSASTISREIKNRRISNKSDIHCPKTERYPFICYNCSYKRSCRKKKFYYNYKEAQKDYEKKLKYSRIGIDMTIDEIQYWDDFFRDKIRDKNQPILHLFNNIKNEFPRSIQTFYKYVHKGYLPSINNEMLARSFSYKPRTKKQEVKTISRDNIIKKGRKFDDFEKYMEQNPNASVVEMDLVIGKFEDNKCIMTLYFKNSKLMLMFIIKKYKPSGVTKVFKEIRNCLGDDIFKEMFEVILTDNGWEFSKPMDIEINYETGEKLVNLFYTDPYSSWQKGSLERNHEFIRYIIPKGISFEDLTKKNVIDMMNHINNVQRKSLDFSTPYSLFKDEFSEDICRLLRLTQIHSNDINLSYKLLIK